MCDGVSSVPDFPTYFINPTKSFPPKQNLNQYPSIVSSLQAIFMNFNLSNLINNSRDAIFPLINTHVGVHRSQIFPVAAKNNAVTQLRETTKNRWGEVQVPRSMETPP